MDRFHVVFEAIAGLVALIALSRLVYHDSMFVSVVSSIAMIASFWFGRSCVKLIRRRRLIGRTADD